MPRGLGDDPLARRRKRSGSAPSNHVTNGPVTQPAVVPETSHNDVFFTRRTDDPQAVPENAPEQLEIARLREITNAEEAPEITEVSDIVRIAEVAQGAKSALPAVIVAPSPPMTEEPAAVVSAASQTSDSSEAQPEPQKSDGFFKRFFRRFGK